MPVVTMRAASQNGGIAIVLIGSAAPTVPDLAINALHLPLIVFVLLDPSPPSSISSPTLTDARCRTPTGAECSDMF